jgi:hypothetical protein
MRVEELFYWMKERDSVFKKKESGLPKPWTKDTILQSFRFCNVYRERDTVTRWISANWREPFHDHPNLFFAMCLARLVNWPDTMAEMDLMEDILENWDSEQFIEVMHSRKDAGLKTFSGAYIVSTNGNTMDKAEYLASRVLSPIWKRRAEIRPRVGDTLSAFAHRLGLEIGMGSFISAQVVADIKYVKPLFDASDWWTWASPGPGSKRGLNRVMNYPIDKPWNETSWLVQLKELHAIINVMVKSAGMPPIHAQDLQNCLCEFDKYERTRLGEGRPRSTYPGHGV